MELAKFGDEKKIASCLAACRATTIDLSYNSLGNTFNMSLLPSTLTRLWLTGNGLLSVPEPISQLSNLEWIYLNGNLLTALPSTLCELPRLTVLAACRNNLAIQGLPDAFYELRGCEVRLSSNRRLPIIFQEYYTRSYPITLDHLRQYRDIRRTVVALLAAHRFRRDSHCFLRWVPRDLVVVIAKRLWASRPKAPPALKRGCWW